MLRVIVWGSGREESEVSDDAKEEDAAFAVVHRDCFESVMHPSYTL
jgi:hypothetical protein